MALKNHLFLCLFLLSWNGFSSSLEKIRGIHPQEQIDFVKNKLAHQEQPNYDAYLQLILYADSVLLRENHAQKSLEYLMAWANTNKKYSNYDGSLVMACSGN
jgi:hypothetical protein